MSYKFPAVFLYAASMIIVLLSQTATPEGQILLGGIALFFAVFGLFYTILDMKETNNKLN